MPAMKDTSMNTNMHSAFTREIGRLRDGLLKADLSDAKATQGLVRRYKFFSITLHQHHEGEDTLQWPVIRPRANPQEITVLDAMEAEHGALASVLGAVDEDFKTLSASSDKDQIAARLDELDTVLSGHTQHEEREGVAIVQKYFEEVTERARFRDEYIQPIHSDLPIFLVRKPKVPLAALWPGVKEYI